MVRSKNSELGSSASPSSGGGRARLIARLVEAQPLIRRRFDASLPAHLRELHTTLHNAVATATVRQVEVLRLLATRGSLAMHELATLQGITRSSATEVVDRLVDHGLVERRQDPQDRRGVDVALTPRAEELVAEVRRLTEASIAALLDIYDDEELGTLVGLLEKLAVPSPVPEGLGPSAPSPPDPPAAGIAGRRADG